MKKTVLLLLAILLFSPMAMLADDYKDLWKLVDEAVKADLPRTQIARLQTIADKAEGERNYGQMLKAEWQMLQTWGTISSDSVRPQMERLEQKAEAYGKTDAALSAVCYAALAKTCSDRGISVYATDTLVSHYAARAMANPALLAAKRADAYEPFTVEGRDADLFGHDLLCLVGYAVGGYEAMHAYYESTGNRTAALLTALDMARDEAEKSGYIYMRSMKSRYVAVLDSLINRYADLEACGEVAIEKLDFMGRCTDVTSRDKAGYITEALNRWGGWQRMDVLRNAMKELTNPEFTASMRRNVMLPGRVGTLNVTCRNIDKLKLTITKINTDGTEKRNPRDSKAYKALKAKAMKGSVQTQTRAFAGHEAYEEVKDSFQIDGLSAGVYLLELSAGDKSVPADRQLLYVSDIFVVHQELPGNKLRFAVVSATTGQPVPRAKLDIVTDNGAKRTLTCGVDGETIYPFVRSNVSKVRAYTEADNAAPYAYARNNFYYNGKEDRRDAVSLYTDRRIYRPGQTVHVAAICRSINGLEQKALQGRTVRLTLRDANYKTVAEKSVITDAYGTASADFPLPHGGLTGHYTIRTDVGTGGAVGFRVEEYKRPTFEVEFPEVTEKYANGDTLTVTGRAVSYSGVPVQGAKVRYKVTRRTALWWRFLAWDMYDGGAANDVLAEGEAVTGGDGTFKVAMPMVLPVWEEGTSGVSEDDFYRISRFYNIIAEADVTDQAGETHSGEISLPLGNRATAFGCDMPEKILRDSLNTITFTLKNAAGADISGDVTYRIDGSDKAFEVKANVPVRIDKAALAGLKSGRHTLTAVCCGDTLSRDFVVFGYDDTTPCVETPDWFYLSSAEFPRDGSPVYLQFGSSDTDVHVLYTVFSGNKVLKSGTLELSNEVVTRPLTYKDEYGTGLRICLAWVKNGTAYTHSETIGRPLPDKRLIVKWETFRDRLTPGQQEEWTLRITKPDGTPGAAQLMATMYDASLDRIAPFSWSFAAHISQSLPYAFWRALDYYSLALANCARLKPAAVPALDFGRIETGNVLVMRNSYPLIKRESQVSRVLSAKAYDADAVLTSTEELAEAKGVVEEAGGATGGERNVQIRENLNETALFYPALRTDSAGIVSVRFTLPESLTTWRFMGLAHDKEMNNGHIEGCAVASKKVMVQPNVPRFVRVGDRATITSRIFNTAGTAVGGTAVMQITDPETETVIAEMSRRFDVDADSVAVVSFDYTPEAGRSLLVCKIFAEGSGFSDGEQHYLPVLSDEELVTVTVPFTQHGRGVKTIDLKPLFADGGRDEKLTVEYTNNPAWLMIQALPYINNAREDDAISLAVAYYANSISAYIMKQSPRIKSVFGQWMREEGLESLMSSLEKNRELKNMVLDETPWVADADAEADQKRLLANCFDESTIANNLSTTLRKLRKLQSPADGSWCWWPGMRYGSPSLTATITELLVRLESLTGYQPDVKGMIDKGLKFLGNVVVDEVKEFKKKQKEGRPYYINNGNAVQYLYICTLNNRKLTADERSAADFLLDYLKQEAASLNIYHKAMMAVVLAGNGETQLAGEYLKSLEEYSVATEEMGRYYDSPRTYYSWCDYGIPTQVAAIEAMRLVDAENYAKTIDEMNIWLLQQKRVQGWDTPYNSANAVYAFLKGNASVLDNREKTILKVDDRQLDTSSATAGLGYVKVTKDGAKAATFTAENTSDGTSWGAVYAQSIQKTSSVASSSAGFNVTREILSPDGKPVTGLTVGDRVTVRITVKADRDYDFVQLKDKRAACMEPVTQLSGYGNGYYCTPKDNATCYYFDRMSKGTHIIETDYYIDRSGLYETGTCSVQCAYAPEYSAVAPSAALEVNPITSK